MIASIDCVATECNSNGVEFFGVKFHLPFVRPFLSLFRSSQRATESAGLEMVL